MPPDFDLTGLGAAGIFILLVLKFVFDFLGRRNGHGPNAAADRQQLQDLHDWHAPDQSGRQTWKVADEVLTKLQDTLDRIETKLDEIRR